MKCSKAMLLAVLTQMRAAVEADDSFEGSLDYSCLEEECDPSEFMVFANWRVGNSEGQGGRNIIASNE